MSNGNRQNKDFKTEAEIQSFFASIKARSPKRWYKAQSSKLSRYTKFLNGTYDCETITDEWFKWYFGRNNAQKNFFEFSAISPSIYFVEPLPFQRPHFTRIAMEQQSSLLVPMYSFSASLEEYPSQKPNSNRLMDLIRSDLAGVQWNTVKATFDGKDVNGYCVIRDKPLTINNVPPQNGANIPSSRLKSGSINIYHGGFWLLQQNLPPGDHLLSFNVNSNTYETNAKILINATY